jgi:hypothetical protein
MNRNFYLIFIVLENVRERKLKQSISLYISLSFFLILSFYIYPMLMVTFSPLDLVKLKAPLSSHVSFRCSRNSIAIFSPSNRDCSASADVNGYSFTIKLGKGQTTSVFRPCLFSLLEKLYCNLFTKQ